MSAATTAVTTVDEGSGPAAARWPSSSAGATRLRYRWPVDGRQPSRSFQLPREFDAAVEFRRNAITKAMLRLSPSRSGGNVPMCGLGLSSRG
ncbi:MAG: hypothetical protein ACLGI8_04865 [Acidimicrobiia bacterium]|jgi:hypothetical protein